MSWAKLDDRFWSNRKVRVAWRQHRASVGLHVMAITYCAQHETDGHVDVDLAEMLLPSAKERTGAVRALIVAGLWTAGDDGWQIHDYLEFNESREDAEARRRRDSERKRRRNPDGIPADSERNPDGIQADSERIPGDPSRARALTRPDPTRPDPTEETPKARERAAERQRVFDAWVSSTGRTDRTVLDSKRRKLIDKALDAYPLQDVLDAVRGWRHSPHHCGQNDTGTVYNDLGLLLRDPGNIERFRDLERRPPTPIRPNGGGWTAADMIRIGKETA